MSIKVVRLIAARKRFSNRPHGGRVDSLDCTVHRIEDGVEGGLQNGLQDDISANNDQQRNKRHRACPFVLSQLTRNGGGSGFVFLNSWATIKAPSHAATGSPMLRASPILL